MRDSGEPDNELMKALRIDDVDKVQSIISSSNIHFNDFNLPFCIFDDLNDNGSMKLINYAAAFGSIKCFKYFVLNHLDMYENTFDYAVYGGNIEIIKIVDQNSAFIPQTETQKAQGIFKTKSLVNRSKDDKSGVTSAIEMHKNDLFDWIYEQKFSNKENSSFANNSFLIASAENGNAYSSIQLIDRSSTCCNFKKLIEIASENGFYQLSKLIFDIMEKRSIEFQSEAEIQDKSEKNSFTSFGNLSIYKLGLIINDDHEYLISTLSYVIQNKITKIFDYILNEVIKNSSQITKSLIRVGLIASIKSDDNYYFNRILEQIKKLNPNALKYYDSYENIFIECCMANRIEYFKEILSITEEYKITPEMTFTFIKAANEKSEEICHFIIDKKLQINYQEIAASSGSISRFSKDIYSIIVDNASPEMKEVFLSCFLEKAIRYKNVDLIKFLLSKGAQIDYALFDAVKSDSLEIVEIILKENSDPSYVNKNSSEGTALLIATNRNNLEIVQRLLNVPGIKLDLYDENDQTPLIASIINLNSDIMNAILDFYGENIKSQTWQIDKAIKMALRSLSHKNDDNNNGFHRAFFKERRKTEIKQRMLSIFKKILEIENVDPNSYGGKHTLLSYACQSNEIDIVQMLLKIDKIDVNTYAPINGSTPLMIALLNKNVEIAVILINNKRTNINARYYDNETALTIACSQELESIVNLIIKHEKFDPVESCLNYAFYVCCSFQKLCLR